MTDQWRYHYIAEKKAIAGAVANPTEEWTTSGFVSDMVIRVYRTTGANTNGPLPIHRIVKNISVMDGSKELKNISGSEAKGLMYKHKDTACYSTQVDTASLETYDDFLICFGRFPGDTKYGVDMSKIENGEIKLELDATTATHDGVAYDALAAPVFKYTISEHVLDSLPRDFTGYFIQSRKINDWAQTVSSWERTSVPRRDPLVGLMIKAGYLAKDWTEDIEEIKLDFGGGAWVPLELREEDIPRMQSQWMGAEAEVSFMRDVIDNMDMDLQMGYIESISMLAMTDVAREFNWQNFHQGLGVVGAWDAAVPAVDAVFRKTAIDVRGLMPYHTYYIPMNEITEQTDIAVSTAEWNRIDLWTLSGAAASTSSRPRVVAEYLINPSKW